MQTPNKYRITNVTNADVVIEDLSIRLSGKGRSVIVDASIADRSRDLVANNKLVKVDKIGVAEVFNLPIWPFAKEGPTPDSKPTAEMASIQHDIGEIKSLLTRILNEMDVRPTPVPIMNTAETVKSGVPASEPMFIPSKITPEVIESDIKLQEQEISSAGLNKGVAALKKLKGKVK